VLERYCTERLLTAQKIRRWCEFGSSTLSRMAVTPYRPERFSAQLLRATLGDVGITHMTSSAAVAESTEGCVGEWATAHSGALGVTYYKAGHLRLTQGSRTLELAPGDVVVRDLRHRWVQDAHEDFTLMTVKIPTQTLQAAFPEFESCVMVPLRAEDPRARLLSSLIENLGRLAFDERAPAGVAPVHDLLRSALQIGFAPLREGQAPMAHRLPGALVRHIDERLADPELSVAALAAELGMTVRSVQRLFHLAGTTPKGWILARRLARAADHLRAVPIGRRVNITRLAMTLGFNDPAYFSRVFHHEFGVTPTDFQRRERPAV
jgi:AraC-like DNA-binding protein